MTPQEAIAKLRALPEEQQRAVLGQLSPDERKGILTQLSGPSVPGLNPGEQLPGVPGAPKVEMRKLGALEPAGGMNADEFMRGAGAGIKGMFTQLPTIPVSYMPTPMVNNPQAIKAQSEAVLQGGKDVRSTEDFAKKNPAFFAGSVAGPTALTAGAAEAIPAIGELGGGIRDAAIGDPNVPALKGLRVPPSSSKGLRTVSAIEGSRPFLSGAKNLADLQAKIPLAKNEIWGPYQKTIDAISDRPANGPDGPTTVGELESERQQLSALNRALKQRDPQAIQTAQQKGLNEAQLLDREKAVQQALDPHLESAGIDPKSIRKAFSQVSTVEGRVQGRTTTAEPKQPYGVAKLGDVSLTKPLSNIPLAGDIIKDMAAGRYWSAKPTDVAIREGFRPGGAKPDFRAPSTAMPPFEQPPRQLPSSVIPNAEVSPSPSGYLEGGRAASTREPIIPMQRELRQLPSITTPGEVQPPIAVARPIPPPPENPTRIYPPGSAFRNLPVEGATEYPPASQFRPKIPPFDLDAYLKGQQ